MILHRDGLLVLEYDIASDVLYVSWPDLSGFSMDEIQYSFQKFIEAIKSYDVKRLLLDSSKTRVDASYEDYKTLMLELSTGFLGTRLERIARVRAEDNMREQLVQQFIQEIVVDPQFSIPYQDFASVQDALDWLCRK